MCHMVVMYRKWNVLTMQFNVIETAWKLCAKNILNIVDTMVSLK